MNLRHLVTKGFDSDITIRRSIVYPGTQLSIGITHHVASDEAKLHEETIRFNKAMPDSVNLVESLQTGRESMIDSPLGSVVVDSGGDFLPLSSCYDFKVEPNGALSEFLPVGTSFDLLVENQDMREVLCDIAEEMFPHVNPNTGEPDIDRHAFYAPYIPLVVMSGSMPPQVQDDSAYFNPEGVVTVAEFLDCLNAVKYGCNANNNRRKSLDNISDESDYFNEGYNAVVHGLSSPFFNLYTRSELMTPITRLELAYITVVCWEQFMNKYNSLYGGQFYLGVSFDWDTPEEVLSKYEDGFNYRISKVSIDTEYSVTSLDIKDYRSDRTMEEYREDLQNGVAALPLPMFMSMLELGVLGLFEYEDSRLDPMREVSRGELCYFLSRIAKHFSTKYIKS